MSQTLSALATRYKQFAPDPELHGTYYPTDVYPGEAISATVRSITAGVEIIESARVWRISPLGLELILDTEPSALQVGNLVDIDLRLGATVTQLAGLAIVKTNNELGNRILGVRLIDRSPERFDGADRRGKPRWICGEQFIPVCVAANPARFSDFVYLRVREISANGMRLLTSLRNKFLVKGMTLDCVTSFPFISQLPLKMVIENVRLTTEGGKDFLSVGVSLGELSRQERQVIGQYLIQFGEGVSLDDLRKQDMAPRSLGSSVEFSFVRTLDDYQQVLELRKLAYRAAAKIPQHFEANDMADIYDTRSRIVIGKHKGKVVASAGLVFNEYHDRMEIEENIEWPALLPRRDEMVEVIRNCTHPSYRGSDLLMAMFQFIAITVTQSKRRYVVIGCTEDLVGLYSRIGMERQNLDYRHSKLVDSPHTVMLGDIPKAMSGATVNPLFWNAVWAPTTRYMVDTQILEMTQADRARMNVYRLFGPISALLQRRMKRPRGNGKNK
jgi:predicted GNAT family N-acyltransferase